MAKNDSREIEPLGHPNEKNTQGVCAERGNHRGDLEPGDYFNGVIGIE